MTCDAGATEILEREAMPRIVESGRLSQAAKLHQELAETLESEGQLESVRRQGTPVGAAARGGIAMAGLAAAAAVRKCATARAFMCGV